MKTFETLLAVINPAAVPTLRIAGGLFLIINVLAAVYFLRHWREFFGRDSGVEGDRRATRQLQIIAISVPWLSLTTRLVIEWVRLWIT